MHSADYQWNICCSSNGGTGTVTISRNGDLVSKVYVRCDQDTDKGINGDKLVSEVELEIGGQRIDRHYEEWNQVWAELTTPESKAAGYKYLTGGFTNSLVSGEVPISNLLWSPFSSGSAVIQVSPYL